ncbi:preprotein translocase subunit SecF [Methylomarinovum caldicuralii]|uniref:Protein-export membrane protein SecF n=1 Tax=Methylomarinovum caldicuralii TaxID=438856 RepID=A0AAU9CVA5_9GAMM|nr:protein translocase subunit SecF [Methylomarinovum caldicuralii]BCX81847.1 preprotein translocase subunit SecF [Methylomarinovum caldicuralii]
MAAHLSERNFDFMGKRRIALTLSTLLILISLGSLIFQGLKLGLDFTGGTLVEVGYDKPVDLAKVRHLLAGHGFEEAAVQHFGSSREILIRLPATPDLSSADLSNRILEVLRSDPEARPQLRRVEFVGPQVGEELTEKGGLAMLFALFGILIYVAWRFEYRFALGSIIALVHDVIITLGFFSITRLEFDLTVLAAILAVIGYSLNDTIVVFDRIRENFRRLRRGTPEEIINISINQTLSRTLITSLTTLLVLIALLVLGGEIIRNFAIALTLGVVVGTYSSIYVASAFLLLLKVQREDLLLPEKPQSDADLL